MRIVDLDQRSDAWHAWRREGITATEGMCLTGHTAFGRTPLKLWRLKKGLEAEPDLSKVPQVRYGVLHEDDCRGAWEKKHGDFAIPMCAEYDGDPIFRASFDGVTSDGIPVECKCPSDKLFREVVTEREKSEVYSRYWPQVQHQMLVAEAPYAWLCVWHEGEYCEFRIERCEDYIRTLLKKGRDFWTKHIEGNTPPEAVPDIDVFEPKADELERWCHLARAFAKDQETLDRLTEEAKAVRTRQKERQQAFRDILQGFRTGEAAGIRVTVGFKTGSIDIDRLLEHCGMTREEAEPFRRAPTEQIRVTIREEEKTAGES